MGTAHSRKARLGHLQEVICKTSSHSVSTTSVNIVAAIAAKECRKVFTVDICFAFLICLVKKY